MGYNYNNNNNCGHYYKENKECRENKGYRENKECKKCKENKEYKENKECKENKEYREKNECREDKEYGEAKGYKEYKGYGENKEYKENCYKVKCHNHEFLSSTDYEEDDEGVEHNHRIAGVTGPPIECGNSHVHKIAVFTDTFDDHFHKICDTTCPAISIGGGKHIHLLKGTTEEADGHVHDYFFTTLIQDPSSVPEDKKC